MNVTENWISSDFEQGLVSVIIPTFNRAALISETLSSLLMQSCEKMEVIVVDDGSSDNTEEVMKEWERRFNKHAGFRLRFVRQAHEGVAAARNRGVRESRGEFIQYFDDDDLMDEVKIEKHVDMIRRQKLDAVYGPMVSFWVSKQGGFLVAPPSYRPYSAHSDLVELILKGWVWALQPTVLRRELVARIGPWDATLPMRDEDLDYILRCALLRPTVDSCDEGVVYHRFYHDGQSLNNSRDPENQRSMIVVADKYERHFKERKLLDKYGSAMAVHWMSTAIQLYKQGNRSMAMEAEKRALANDDKVVSRTLGIVSRICNSLGGLRLVAAKNKYVTRAFRKLHVAGHRHVDKLYDGMECSSVEGETQRSRVGP